MYKEANSGGQSNRGIGKIVVKTAQTDIDYQYNNLQIKR